MSLKCSRTCPTCSKTVFKGTDEAYYTAIDGQIYHRKCIGTHDKLTALYKSEKCSECGEMIRAGTRIDGFEVIDSKFYHSACITIEPLPQGEVVDEGTIQKSSSKPFSVAGTADSTSAAPINFVGDGWYSQSKMSKLTKPSPDWVYRMDQNGSEHAKFVGKHIITQSECDDNEHRFCGQCPDEKTCFARPFPTHSAWRAWAHAEIGTNRDPAQRHRFMQPDWDNVGKYGALGRKATPKPLAENQHPDERKGPGLWKPDPTPTVVPDTVKWMEEQEKLKLEKQAKTFEPLDLKPRENNTQVDITMQEDD
jgi:hypothetical protein